MSEESHELRVDVSPEAVLSALAGTAEEWGAEWTPQGDGGRLYLPVLAGLRRGLMEGRVRVRSSGSSTRLILEAETTHWRVHRAAAAVLVMGLLGALPVLLWPLGTEWLALAPVGLVLMFLAWFMVVSRLRTAGAVEFLEAVRHRVEGPDPGV